MSIRNQQLGSRAHSRARGFTLVEAMIVVAIVGILSSLAVYGVRKYILASKSSEATQMISAIKAAQEAYKADTFGYLDVSGSHALGDMSSFYPTQTPSNKRYAWGGGTDAVAEAWRALNVQTDGSGVYYAYGCAAGGQNDAVAATSISVFGGNWDPHPGNWPTVLDKPWYVVKAVADLDGDGKNPSVYVTGSFTESIFLTTDTD